MPSDTNLIRYMNPSFFPVNCNFSILKNVTTTLNFPAIRWTFACSLPIPPYDEFASPSPVLFVPKTLRWPALSNRASESYVIATTTASAIITSPAKRDKRSAQTLRLQYLLTEMTTSCRENDGNSTASEVTHSKAREAPSAKRPPPQKFRKTEQELVNARLWRWQAGRRGIPKKGFNAPWRSPLEERPSTDERISCHYRPTRTFHCRYRHRDARFLGGEAFGRIIAPPTGQSFWSKNRIPFNF